MKKKKFNIDDYYSLPDDAIVSDGDVIKSLVRGSYSLITETSIDWLLEGMTVGRAKQTETVNDVLRKKTANGIQPTADNLNTPGFAVSYAEARETKEDNNMT